MSPTAYHPDRTLGLLTGRPRCAQASADLPAGIQSPYSNRCANSGFPEARLSAGIQPLGSCPAYRRLLPRDRAFVGTPSLRGGGFVQPGLSKIRFHSAYNAI